MSGALPDSKASLSWSLYSSAKTWKSTLMPVFVSSCLKRSVFTALSWRWLVIQTTVVPANLLPDGAGTLDAAAAEAAEGAGADDGFAAGGAVAVAAVPHAASG